MALRFFKQRDIDEMDISNIPEEFINYFDTLDDVAKSALLERRPDLAKALGFEGQRQENFSQVHESVIENASVGVQNMETKAETKVSVPNINATVLTGSDVDRRNSDSVADENPDTEYRKIANNYYEGTSVLYKLQDNMKYFEALTIPDKTDQCPIHRTKLKEKQIRFTMEGTPIYGLKVKACEKCNRAFLEESKSKYVHKDLLRRNVSHTILGLELSTRYLRSNMEVYVLGEGEKLYVSEPWIEENPICPIHDSKLFEIPCEHIYKNRKVSFQGYLCESCNKVLVRKSVAIHLQDQCHEKGLPEIPYETLAKKKPAKKPERIQKIKPRYCVEDGKRTECNYENLDTCYRLTEEDKVIVSDSIYCDLKNHRSEEVAAVIWMQEKRGGRNLYLFLLGYCLQCQKYYMDMVDYKVIYPLGRPEVTILLNIEDHELQITSGEVFGIEKAHLNRLETDISDEISSIKSSPDYVSRYTTGDYDDGALSYAKTVSKEKYGARLKELNDCSVRPYTYRVDISHGDETEVYYLGGTDIEIQGQQKVVSLSSDFGRELVHYQTLKVMKNGREYAIKLSRKFDIDHATLFGYVNLRTDEDLIFRKGITDPFLVRVLNMRKRQHNLTDIFVTIQENQNRIVNVDFRKSLIVQGCAGSGKTMVLLHRLSSLKYKHKYFDFEREALILTPNEQFSLHIKGLAEELQIGNIKRVSVEQYYVDRLLEYDRSFKPDRAIASEENVPQAFVDYVYSDQFKTDFAKAYDHVIAERNTLAEILENLTDAMRQPKRTIDFSQNARVIQQIRYGVEAMDLLVTKQEQVAQNAKAKLDEYIARKQYLDEKVPAAREEASIIVIRLLPGVNTEIGEFLHQKESEIEQSKQQLQSLNSELEKVRRTIIMIGKRARLEGLENEIKKIEKNLYETGKIYEEAYETLSQSQEGKTDAEIIEWMKQVRAYIPNVQDYIRRCENVRENLTAFETEYSAIDSHIEQAQQTYAEEQTKLYPNEVKDAIQYLYERINRYSLQNTFQMVFDETVSEFMQKHEIKPPQGKYYRYILYAELIFARKYYGEVHGETRFMCVDEGQDLALNEYKLIYELNRYNMVFDIFGDVNQLIKPGRGISDWSELKTLFHAELFQLNENYRNTNQITWFCNHSFDMNVLQTGVDGAAVREIPRNKLEDELSSIDIGNDSVALLIPRSMQKRIYLDTNKIPDARKERIGNRIENGYIALMYVDEVKGIEFQRVFVVANGMTKNEKYIAYTRALSELVIVVDEAIAPAETV